MMKDFELINKKEFCSRDSPRSGFYLTGEVSC